MSQAQIYTADEVNELFKQLMDHQSDKLILISIPMSTTDWKRYAPVYSISFSTNSAWNQLTGNTDFLTKPGNYLAYWTDADSMFLRIINDYSEFHITPIYCIYQNNSLLVESPTTAGTTNTSQRITLKSGINYFKIYY